MKNLLIGFHWWINKLKADNNLLMGNSIKKKIGINKLHVL